MDQQSTATSPSKGASTPHDLFVLTDEQILEIEPEGEVNVAPRFSAASSAAVRGQNSGAGPNLIPSLPAQAGEARDHGTTLDLPSVDNLRQDSSRTNRAMGQSSTSPAASQSDDLEQGHPADTEHGSRTTDHNAQPGVAVPQELPPWLAAQMKDPWSGGEVKEFWNGVQQARQEAAAYRAAFATPEDARALKELYPGGVNEALAAANRAHLLEEIDRAYFGAPGGSPEHASAARADLAQRMLREDPAAFREMVFAGLRALEAAEKGSVGAASTTNLPRLAQVFASSGAGVNVAPRSSAASSPPVIPSEARDPGNTQDFAHTHGARHDSSSPSAPRNDTIEQLAATTGHESHSAYAVFEKAANEDLERSVGAAIARTLEQALPNLARSNTGGTEGARQGVPLQDRLSAAVRQDVEAALKGDRQLSEQIAQILSARRFDNETRAQVVRLIDDRARQLVPSAARRVINDWTQTTLAAHRGNAARADAASTRREVEPVAAQGSAPAGRPANQAGGPAAFSSQAAQTRPGTDSHRNASRSDARRLDYRKLSDEQILDL